MCPISAAVAQVNYEYNERLEELQTADSYDSISVTGQSADWVEVLAVFAVKVAGSNDADAADVATMDTDRHRSPESGLLGYDYHSPPH